MAQATQIYGPVNSQTARKINHRAEQIGADADYDEKWGK